MRPFPPLRATLLALGIASAMLAAWSRAAPAQNTPVTAAQTARFHPQAGVFRYRLGAFEITALSDGSVPQDLHALLKDTSRGEIDTLLAHAHRANPVEASINAYLIDTGSRLMLVDVGAGDFFGPGSGWVSAWALQATDGVVLIDALNTAEEVDQLIVGGMKQLGMDPAQIKAVVVTHSHGDQYDGAQRINEVAAVSEPRIVMTDLDWKMTGTALEFASPLWPAPPRYDAQRDVSAKDGDVFRHGGTDVRLPQTPGHTMGTISPILEVKLGCVTHRAMIWGGTGFNFGRDLDRMDAPIRSTERMKDLVRQLSVDVLLSNHQSYDGTMDKVAALRGSRPADAPHPYIVGKETVIRALTAAGECARANQVRFEMTPVTLAFGRMPVQSLARR